jgi:hypothetical protein
LNSCFSLVVRGSVPADAAETANASMARSAGDRVTPEPNVVDDNPWSLLDRRAA